MNITFTSDDHSSDFEKALSEYRQIWAEDGVQFVEALEKYTKRSLGDEKISIMLVNGPSTSGRSGEVMRLRYNYPLQTKKATFIHELAHRYIEGVPVPEDWDDVHQVLNLFLYDLWVELYGVEFSDDQVKIEQERSERYMKSWDWALSMIREERSKKLWELLN